MYDIIYLYPLIIAAVVQVLVVAACFIANAKAEKVRNLAQISTMLIAGSTITALFQVLGIEIISLLA